MGGNASSLEILWTAINAISWLCTILVGTITVVRGIRALRLHSEPAKLMLFLLRIGLFVLFFAWSGLFTLVGVFAMFTPPPVITSVQRTNDIAAWVSIGLALLLMLYLIAEVILGPSIDVAIARSEDQAEQARKQETRLAALEHKMEWNGTTERRQGDG